MPSVETSSGQMWFAGRRQDLSEQPPVLLVHGAGGSHLDWPAELRRLKGWHTLAVDLPGHGRSTGPGRANVADYAATIVALLDALALDRVIVCGHSMGGAIAQTLAFDYPDRVAGLILIGTGAKLRVHPDVLSGVLTNPGETYATITHNMWVNGTPDEVLALGVSRFKALDAATVHDDLEACNAFDSMSRVQEIGVPTLVVGGTEDRMTPFKFSIFLAEQIPRAELVTIAGGGHMMALEQPEAVQVAVRDWLARTF